MRPGQPGPFSTPAKPVNILANTCHRTSGADRAGLVCIGKTGVAILTEAALWLDAAGWCGAAAVTKASTSQETNSGERTGRIVPFAPRRPAGIRSANSVVASPPRSRVGNVESYSHRGAEPDDYRHRMTTNVIAFVFVAFLSWCGLWLADSITQMRNNQDCVLSGRRGCTLVDNPVHQR